MATIYTWRYAIECDQKSRNLGLTKPAEKGDFQSEQPAFFVRLICLYIFNDSQ